MTPPATQELAFAVPPDRIPTAPPERRGIPRDGVRLMVATPRSLVDTRFHAIGTVLGPDDVVVVNTSATRPAAVDGPAVTVHLSTHVAGRRWVVELREPDGSGPVLEGRDGQVVRLPGDAQLTLASPVASGPQGRGTRLWLAEVDVPSGTVSGWLSAHGRAITYGVDAQRWPLEDHQTVFARHDGSAEMPSAGRPFTPALVTDLVRRGIPLAPVQLHAGVGSQEAGEPPGRERYVVGAQTAALVNHARSRGGRVIAVGTTVTRALETVARPDGTVHAGSGWTSLVLGPQRPARVVDGLVSGWHEADASHLELLRAVADVGTVARAYRHALVAGYTWHEFGDSALFLP